MFHEEQLKKKENVPCGTSVKKAIIMKNSKTLHTGLIPFLNCIDYTVSKDGFEVMKNEKYDMLVTSPIPVNLSDYYKSDDYISHTDSKKTLFDKVYQQVKNYTLQKKVTLLNSFASEEKTVLDIGAGTGDFLSVCKKKNWQVFGVEPDFGARKIAASKQVNLRETLADFKGENFDVITMWHVLEHIENLHEHIKELKKLLKPNGTLVIAVPNFKSYDAIYYNQFWAAFDVPRHLWHFSQKAIKELFLEVDMEVIKTIPMKFDSYYVSLLSEKYKNGSTNIFKAFYIGFTSNRNAKRTSEYSSLIYVIKNN